MGRFLFFVFLEGTFSLEHQEFGMVILFNLLSFSVAKLFQGKS